MRRWAVGLVGSISLLCVATPALAAPPDPEPIVCPRTGGAAPGATFKVSGPGAEAFFGGWDVKGARASLCFRGAGGAGGLTSVIATWTSPWIASGSPQFDTSYDFSAIDPSSDVLFVSSSRSRVRGGAWSGWSSMQQPSTPPAGGGGGGSGEGIFFASAGKPRSMPPAMRWEWRFRSWLPGPAVLDFQASMLAR